MKKIVNIIILVSFITYFIFIAARAVAVFQRGNLALGGEMLLLLVPLVTWIIYRNILTTKEEIKDYKLTDESESLNYIKCPDNVGSIQIMSIDKIE